MFSPRIWRICKVKISGPMWPETYTGCRHKKSVNPVSARFLEPWNAFVHFQFSLEVDHLILTERPLLKLFASTTHGQCAVEIKDVLHQLQQTWLDLVKVVFAILEKELDAIFINLLMDFPENVKVLPSLKDHLKCKKAMSDSGNVCTIKCVPQQVESIFFIQNYDRYF